MNKALVVLLAVLGLTKALPAEEPDDFRRPTPGIVYLLDVLSVQRPGLTDEEPVEENNNFVTDSQDDNKQPRPLAFILVNNPIKEEDATADGIYFRPANNQPLDRSQSVSETYNLSSHTLN